MWARNDRRLKYLAAMGIQVWLPAKSTTQAVAAYLPVEVDPKNSRLESDGLGDSLNPETGYGSRMPISQEKVWDGLKDQVVACTTCSLHCSRTQTVFGSGSYSASWMVIGEAPGASEDQQGKPFVGRAGQLLTEMLRALGLERSEVFITNILKCRPPQNRDPRPDEVEACERFLKKQLAIVNPRIILAVGRIAAQSLLKTDAPLGRLRGKVHQYGDIPVIVVYHPAYLLRSPLEKRKAWTDLRFAMQTLQVRSE